MLSDISYTAYLQLLLLTYIWLVGANRAPNTSFWPMTLCQTRSTFARLASAFGSICRCGVHSSSSLCSSRRDTSPSCNTGIQAKCISYTQKRLLNREIKLLIKTCSAGDVTCFLSDKRSHRDDTHCCMTWSLTRRSLWRSWRKTKPPWNTHAQICWFIRPYSYAQLKKTEKRGRIEEKHNIGLHFKWYKCCLNSCFYSFTDAFLV